MVGMAIRSRINIFYFDRVDIKYDWYDYITLEIMKKGKKDFRVQLLRWWVRERRYTPIERISSRVGYMGAGFLMAGQWTVEPVLFMIGFCCVLFQVTVRKQWNLVVLQLNGLTAWTIHFFNNL